MRKAKKPIKKTHCFCNLFYEKQASRLSLSPQSPCAYDHCCDCNCLRQRRSARPRFVHVSEEQFTSDRNWVERFEKQMNLAPLLGMRTKNSIRSLTPSRIESEIAALKKVLKNFDAIEKRYRNGCFVVDKNRNVSSRKQFLKFENPDEIKIRHEALQNQFNLLNQVLEEKKPKS